MAFEFYVTIDGAQGRIKGEADHAGHAGKIPGRWFRSRLAVPRDGAGGSQGQRRKHEPLTFRKIVGISSPRMLAALCSGELLPSVLFEFIHRTKEGQEAVGFTIKLSDATICGHTLVSPGLDAGHGLMEEEIEMTARRISWEARGGDSVAKATDDWSK